MASSVVYTAISEPLSYSNFEQATHFELANTADLDAILELFDLTKDPSSDEKKMFVLTFTNSVGIDDFDKSVKTIEKIAKINSNSYAMVLVGTNSTSESEGTNEKLINLL